MEGGRTIRYPRQEDFHHPPFPRRPPGTHAYPLDSSETSEWFNVNQGLCKGYVLSPGLFSIFFAVVQTLTFDRVSINK